MEHLSVFMTRAYRISSMLSTICCKPLLPISDRPLGLTKTPWTFKAAGLSLLAFKSLYGSGLLSVSRKSPMKDRKHTINWLNELLLYYAYIMVT